MSARARLAVIAFILCCAASGQHAQSQTKPKKDAVATVSGTVTIKGKPAAGIVVGLRMSQPDETSPTFKATSDQEGAYHIKDVPVGSYEAAPVAPAFVILNGNNARSQTVIVAGSENVDGVDFDLMRGGVITGRITDADGRPVVEERVSLSAADQRDLRAPEYPGNFLTDDRGIYRMFGIRPGRYKVFVGEGENTGFRFVGRGRPPLTQTFYVDPSDPSKPGVIEIAEGTEATKIDITVGAAIKGFSASGRIVDGETGKPIPNAAISLARIITDGNNTRGYGGGGTNADAQGEFRIQNLPPGNYSVSCSFRSDSDIRVDQPVRFEIVDQDVTGLVIKTLQGASISGTVVLDGSIDNAVNELPGRIWVSALTRSADNPNVTSSRGAPINPDGSFHIGGLDAGVVTFSIDMRGSRRLTISRVERDGLVQPDGIRIENGDHLTGIRLLATFHSGSIRGSVKIQNGTLPSGVNIVVQLGKSDEQNRPLQGSQIDARGHFLIEGLASGNYQVTVFVYMPGGQRALSAKQIVTVTDGAATNVTITLDPTQSPNP